MTDREHGVEPVSASRKDVARSVLSRLKLGHVVMVTAALLAMVLNLAILSGGDATVSIVVAASDIAAGTRLAEGHLATAPVPDDDAVTARFVLADDLGRTAGMISTRALAVGDPVLASDLLPSENRTGLRAMSVPIDPTRAVSGNIEAGDTVDVVLVADGTATFIAITVEVLDVPSDATNALGARSGYAPTLAVDAHQALRIAAALDSGEVHLIRSTGAVLPDLEQAAALAGTQAGQSE